MRDGPGRGQMPLSWLLLKWEICLEFNVKAVATFFSVSGPN